MRRLLTILFVIIFSHSYAQRDSVCLCFEDSTVIGFATHDLYQRLPEGSLGNFVADAIKTAVQLKWGNKIDIALISPQSIKGKIEKGTFRKNKIPQLLPYPDSIAIIQLDSSALKTMLDKIASFGGYAISGLQMQINNMRADSININRIPLHASEKYTVAIPYFLTQKNRLPLPKDIEIFNASLSVQSAVCEYIRWLTNTGKTISPVPYRRIKYAN